jgi:hypothetical protein
VPGNLIYLTRVTYRRCCEERDIKEVRRATLLRLRADCSITLRITINIKSEDYRWHEVVQGFCPAMDFVFGGAETIVDLI